MTRIVHLTSVHARYDTRIFLKECRSLARAGYGVSLVVADGLGDENRDGVQILDVGASGGRLNRMLRTTRRVLRAARALDADLYHLHDPELIPAGLQLKSMGKRVVFDAHEDVPLQILGKHYLAPAVRRLVSRTFAVFEGWACRRFDAIVAATPAIREKFSALYCKVVSICNFPLPGELQSDASPQSLRSDVCYIGGISEMRGIRVIVSAMEMVKSPARLKLCGVFTEPSVSAEVRRQRGWARVDELGFVDRVGVRDVLSTCLAGLVTLRASPNFVESLPIKMFEYMSAGVPVVASDFPLWRDIVLDSECGICVDPESPEQIARAIDLLASTPTLAHAMGEKGRTAIRNRYNWFIEERKLLDLYDSLLAA
jgi:glycosyltransferase involved in cell wall biosynthesis